MRISTLSEPKPCSCCFNDATRKIEFGGYGHYVTTHLCDDCQEHLRDALKRKCA